MGKSYIVDRLYQPNGDHIIDCRGLVGYVVSEWRSRIAAEREVNRIHITSKMMPGTRVLMYKVCDADRYHVREDRGVYETN